MTTRTSTKTRIQAVVGSFVGVVGVSAAAGVLAAPAGSVSTVEAQNCPNSMTESIWSAGCLPGVDSPQGAVDNRGPNQLPTLRGIPCSSDCLDLNRVLPDTDTPEPDTTVHTNP